MLCKIRLGKVLFSYNYKHCQKAQTFSQGPLKLTCAKPLNVITFDLTHDDKISGMITMTVDFCLATLSKWDLKM